MILEYDGEQFHRLPHDREDDRRRDHELNALGCHVEHVTKADLANPAALRMRILAVRRALLRRQQTSSHASP